MSEAIVKLGSEESLARDREAAELQFKIRDKEKEVKELKSQLQALAYRFK